MYIKNIYDEWNLHHDATQLEISYNFLTKFIDILDVEKLSKTFNNEIGIVTDSDTLREWKIHEINKILNQFKDISNHIFPNVKWFDHPKLFIKSIFIAGNILNSLKVTNYKASELNAYYEPKLFVYAQKYLDLEVLEEWVSMLSLRILDINSHMSSIPTRQFDWTLSTDPAHLKNVLWYVENLLLDFKDITTWFNQFKIDQKFFNSKHARIINTMNHMIVYGLTDFFAKYYTELMNSNYLTVYNDVLNEIAIDVKNKSFAIVSFNQLSAFLNVLLNRHILNVTDAMINNYLEFIKICCSSKNVTILKDRLFKEDLTKQFPVQQNTDDFSPAKLTEKVQLTEEVPYRHNDNGEFTSFESYQTFKKTVILDDNNNDIPVVSYKTSMIDSTNDQVNLEKHEAATSVLSNLTKPLIALKNKFSKTKSNDISISEISNASNNDVQNEIDFSQEEVEEYE